MKQCRYDAVRKGFVASATGRKRFFPKAPSRFTEQERRRLAGAIERAGTNAPIQGINGDVLKRATILMAPRLAALGAKFRLWVHDEILVDCREEDAQEVARIMDECLVEGARACNLARVPVETSVEIDAYWKQ